MLLGSSHPSRSLAAPLVAGLLVKIFMWVLEMPVVGWVLLYILKKDNLINKLVSEAEIPEPPLFTSTHRWEDTPEQNVSLTKPGLSTAERVREAIDCLPARQIRFNNLVEKGRHAEVYKGQLADGQFVAVKGLTKILNQAC
ncbi:hypothetical protein CFC21_040629 [Triticum aestivum]|uniref:Serine-threonine/tyrosine-protein kinase catalytic domain-containing protein n=2 Tax=Triticum aestivum TaxID=4565 RepID=A0A9R1JTD1_WHEAT|nr:fatty acid amide hydrolase-like isoform X2 [Triticum dicoccoides]XP_044348013.1 fatty acid amide hydrolase-like isoform X2 [Triticum aestivum]KAF7028762.1 hypothetical protein CFC21_040629 [Triticum aestivum]